MTKLQNVILDKVANIYLKKYIGYLGDYYINNNIIYLEVSRENLELFKPNNLLLPSWEEISKKIKRILKFFDESVIDKIVYDFSHLNLDCKLSICAKNSDIVLNQCYLNDLEIEDANNVEINYNLCKGEGEFVNINAKNILFHNVFISELTEMCLKSENVSFELCNLISSKETEIESKKIFFSCSEIGSYSVLTLNADKIVSKSSVLRAFEKLVINNKNCDEIKGVSSVKIIYNGVDITNSDGILLPQAREKLLSTLRKVRNDVIKNIKEEAKNRPITKILNI